VADYEVCARIAGVLVLGFALLSCARRESERAKNTPAVAPAPPTASGVPPDLLAPPPPPPPPPVWTGPSAWPPDRRSAKVELGRPLFSCFITNFAWGRVNYGQVLDDQGRIWLWDLSGDYPRPPPPGKVHDLAGLKEGFKHLALQSRRVSPAQLAGMREQAAAARDGHLESKQVLIDAGASGCEAFIWDTPDSYATVRLGSHGDFLVQNSKPEAGELWEELRDLGLQNVRQ
jgi:hypothetical protein